MVEIKLGTQGRDSPEGRAIMVRGNECGWWQKGGVSEGGHELLKSKGGRAWRDRS